MSPTWTEAVLGHAREWGARPAITDAVTGEAHTYGQIAHQVEQAAAGLCRRGLEQGDLVAVYLRAGCLYPIAMHAVAAAGGIALPISVDLGPELFRERLSSGRVRMMISEGCHPPGVTEDSWIRQIFTSRPVPGATLFSELSGTETWSAAVHALSWDGEKLITHDQLVAGLTVLAGVSPVTRTDVLLVTVADPRAFDLGLAVGAHIVAAHEPSPGTVLLLADEHRVTTIVASPRLAAHLSERTSLRVIRIPPPR